VTMVYMLTPIGWAYDDERYSEEGYEEVEAVFTDPEEAQKALFQAEKLFLQGMEDPADYGGGDLADLTEYYQLTPHLEEFNQQLKAAGLPEIENNGWLSWEGLPAELTDEQVTLIRKLFPGLHGYVLQEMETSDVKQTVG
jgi:hypothetical protein